MRKIQTINSDWLFTGPDGKKIPVNVPHTWNAVDGQDGGNDYWRGTNKYDTTFAGPDFNIEKQCVYCNKEVNIKKDDYIGTQGKDRRYRLAHRSCYNDYLDYIKKIWRG